MSAWTAQEIERFSKRVPMFVRRGMSGAQAELIAESLVRRDRERDDRRMCVECSHLQRDGGCFSARQGWIHGATKRMEPVLTILARCESFKWAMP
jgi:hypothetical protein